MPAFLLQVLRDQSSYSSWYFIERAYIGEINANVTIALTSSVLNARSATAPLENAGGLFSRFIGASGFQLINVNNIPLSLGSWSVDTKLLGRKAMVNSLARHYFAQGIAEAHKVRWLSTCASMSSTGIDVASCVSVCCILDEAQG